MEEHLGQTLGHYQLVCLLSDRFFSQLYLGHHLQDTNPVLIRVLDLFPPLADEEAHFLAELQQFIRLRHPHLLPIRDGGVQNHLPFLVMDSPSRGTLRECHPQGRQLPLMTVLSYVTSLAAALEYLHLQQVAHRYLYPDEVWVGTHHQLLLSEPLTDLERSFGPREELIDYVLPEEVFEPFAYMAPECLGSQPETCSASDQYALAIMIYEWLCGECPFKGRGLEIPLQQLHAPPPPLHQKVPTIPPEVEEVVLIALEKDPQKRFASVRAFVTALEQATRPILNVPGGSSFVYVEEGKEPGGVYELHRPVVYIGRGKPGLDIALEDRLVACEHARFIRLEDGSYGIMNQNHAIGVLVNGRTLTWMELSPLRDGDRVQIGQTVLVFRSGRQ